VRAACIDIGSNTTRLLVADCDATGLVEVHQERAFTRLGRGLRDGGIIAEEKISEVVGVVLRQLAVAREHGAAELCGVATAAVRTAANGTQLVHAIARASGLEVKIVSEAEEARLAFLGAAMMLKTWPDGELGVIDVGGGSSEIVVGRPPDRISWWSSVAVGSGALTERRLGSDPPTAAELATARADVERALAGREPPRPAEAVAVGGSATSLSRVAGSVLDARALQRSLNVLTGEPAAVVARRFAIDPERARLLPAGLLILEATARLLQTTLTVGRGGIREGVLLEARGL
jgi:exopolyphosphatase / guanosine-5'-triphosphate,3'-diphosphate pyrophosphatase